MPFKDPTARRVYQRERLRKKRAERVEPATIPPIISDPITELATWAKETLIVPPGHPLSGTPMALPPYMEAFLRDGWGSHESACCVGRKNSKTAGLAILMLGFLVGPLRTNGWRGAACSVSLEKAGELRRQVAAIAEASKLDVVVRRSPYPGAIESSTGSFETLSADRSSGHASGYDIVCVDETGLFPERSRDLLAGLRSSVSAKGGRIVHISVRGDSPLYSEILTNPATLAHVYAAPDDCALDDESAWYAANPTLGTIKQIQYMRDEVTRIAGAPGDENSFRAFDLNQLLSPTREMICSPSDLKKCFVDDLPPREGPAYLGFDFGESVSGTSAACAWPKTGRFETWLAFGSIPDMIARGRRDDADYASMVRRGELKLYPGRVVQLDKFLSDVQTDLAGVHVAGAAADGYKDKQAMDFMDRAKVRWPITFRRVGAGKDGGADCRAFQSLILGQKIRMKASLSLSTAILKSTIHRDQNGNPGLAKAKANGRIDVLSSSVIACGLAEPHFDRPAKRRRYRSVIAG